MAEATRQPQMSDSMRRFIAESEEADRRIAAGEIVPVDSYSKKFQESPGVFSADEETPLQKLRRDDPEGEGS